MPEYSMSQVGTQQLVPLLRIRDMEVSRRFYVDGLGFVLRRHWSPEGAIRWCWLEHGGAALMLQTQAPPATDVIPTAAATPGFGVDLNFMCTDALALFHVLRERGIATQRPFVGNGLWVVSLRDPDGYQLHFESPTDETEDSEYSG